MNNCFDCVTFWEGNPCDTWEGEEACENFQQVDTRTEEQITKAENRRKNWK